MRFRLGTRVVAVLSCRCDFFALNPLMFCLGFSCFITVSILTCILYIIQSLFCIITQHGPSQPLYNLFLQTSRVWRRKAAKLLTNCCKVAVINGLAL
jgi:hypothetical protein